MISQNWRMVRRFLRDESGAVVVDFIPVFFVMIIMILVIFEIGIAYFLNLRSLKAAQMGARIAAVLEPVHSGVPRSNEKVNPLARDGQPCYNPNGADRCIVPSDGPWVCDGSAFDGACDQDRFTQVIRDMRRVFGNIEPSAVTITYIYRRLGETGGPFIPEVNVSIAPHSYDLVMFSKGDGSIAPDGTRTGYGAVSASAYGEYSTGSSDGIPEGVPADVNG